MTKAFKTVAWSAAENFYNCGILTAAASFDYSIALRAMYQFRVPRISLLLSHRRSPVSRYHGGWETPMDSGLRRND